MRSGSLSEAAASMHSPHINPSLSQKRSVPPHIIRDGAIFLIVTGVRPCMYVVISGFASYLGLSVGLSKAAINPSF